MENKALLIIPTYNELDNLQKLLPELKENHPNLDILIVDDNSPDGTAKYVKSVQENNSHIYMIERRGKMGLGTAYVEGFNFMLKNGYEYAFQMDADYSHDPKEIKNFLNAIKDCDLVIGSRYISGVNVINWPMKRLLLSFFANKYTKFITGLPLADSTGGFKCFRRKVLESIDLSRIKSNGYSFQIEMNYKAWKAGFKIKEIPIIFVDRMLGRSKMSKKIVREAIVMVWKLRFRSILGKL
jgi:dolichol-phosphate mannosyltransferase